MVLKKEEGKPWCTYSKTDEFSGKFQRAGGVVFNPKNHFADLGLFEQELEKIAM